MAGIRGDSEVLLKDGAVYAEHYYADELELQAAFVEHVNDIFGPDALLFSKSKIKSKGGTGSIPDAFLFDLNGPRWFLVEVELARHPLHDHIISQVSRFRAGLSNPPQLVSLKKAFYAAISEDPDKKTVFKRKGVSEVYKSVFETLDRTPEIRIVVDDASQELLEALEHLSGPIATTALKTYYRNGTAAKDHIHRFIRGFAMARPSFRDPRPHSPGGPEGPRYIDLYRRRLTNPNSFPSRMKNYVEERGSTTLKEMKRDLSGSFGYKPTGGGWQASVTMLVLDGHIRTEGRGEDKRLLSAS